MDMMDLNNEDKVVAYTAIKEIVNSTEDLKLKKYQEAIQNNWMSDYTEYAEKMDLNAYEKIKELTKD